MRIFFNSCLVLVFGALIISCQKTKAPQKVDTATVSAIEHEDYDLTMSSADRGLMILFPGAGGIPTYTKENFKIVDPASEHGISVLIMNFSSKLWIDEAETAQLSRSIVDILAAHEIHTDNIYFGGLSIGGNMALTVANYCKKNVPDLNINGVFIVDSPIDLYMLYQSAKYDISRAETLSQARLQEPEFIINYFDENFGKEGDLLTEIQKFSPVTLATDNVHNIENLKSSALRLYTEPDTIWWKENRATEFEQTNAYLLRGTAALLAQLQWPQVELIETQNKGYRADGSRHPHSWSIVDVDDLIDWMLQ